MDEAQQLSKIIASERGFQKKVFQSTTLYITDFCDKNFGVPIVQKFDVGLKAGFFYVQ